jgi:hypothetical protein
LLLSGKQPYQRTTLQEQGLTTGLLALLLLIASIRGRSSGCVAFDWSLDALQGYWFTYRIDALQSGWMPYRIAGFMQTATPKDYTTPKNRD